MITTLKPWIDFVCKAVFIFGLYSVFMLGKATFTGGAIIYLEKEDYTQNIDIDERKRPKK